MSEVGAIVVLLAVAFVAGVGGGMGLAYVLSRRIKALLDEKIAKVERV